MNTGGFEKILQRKSHFKKASVESAMADKNLCDMLYFICVILLIEITSPSYGITVGYERPCNCYDACSRNYTTNSSEDGQNITACQRGCRFHSLALHTSHEPTAAKDNDHAKEGCISSCSESYNNYREIEACNFGCSAMNFILTSCNTVGGQLPQISYSVFIEESDVLIHPGEPDPDDVLTDPGLRKQFERTLEALFDTKPKLPEIHFRNLPIKNQKSEYSHASFKCPKFYGFDTKFEIQNGKLVVWDIYVFVGVLVFSVFCFVLGHHMEKGKRAKRQQQQLLESRIRDGLVGWNSRLDIIPEKIIEKKKKPEYVIKNMSSADGMWSETHVKSNSNLDVGGITVVIEDEYLPEVYHDEKKKFRI